MSLSGSYWISTHFSLIFFFAVLKISTMLCVKLCHSVWNLLLKCHTHAILTHLRPLFYSCENQSGDSQLKSVEWFLYVWNSGLRWDIVANEFLGGRECHLVKTCSKSTIKTSDPLSTTLCKLSLHKTLWSHPGGLLKVLNMFSLRPVPLGDHCVKSAHG